MTIKRNGGLWFWRIGRIGGSFYIARKRQASHNEWIIAIREDRVVLSTMSAALVVLSYIAAAY